VAGASGAGPGGAGRGRGLSAAFWWPALSGAPLAATARTVAALGGLPPYAAVGVAGPLLVGIGQAVVAFWLARAVTYRLR